MWRYLHDSAEYDGQPRGAMAADGGLLPGGRLVLGVGARRNPESPIWLNWQYSLNHIMDPYVI